MSSRETPYGAKQRKTALLVRHVKPTSVQNLLIFPNPMQRQHQKRTRRPTAASYGGRSASRLYSSLETGSEAWPWRPRPSGRTSSPSRGQGRGRRPGRGHCLTRVRLGQQSVVAGLFKYVVHVDVGTRQLIALQSTT